MVIRGYVRDVLIAGFVLGIPLAIWIFFIAGFGAAIAVYVLWPFAVLLGSAIGNWLP